MKAIQPTHRRAALLSTLIALVLSAGGCAPSGGLRLTSHNGNTFAQQFPHAYITTGDDGQYQIVLLDEPPDERQDGGEKTIAPASAAPLRQVVVIHVLWRPLRGVETDHPSATNAAIDWYVTGTGSGRHSDLLHYQGAGFVRILGGGERVTVDIRNAGLAPATIAGNVTDPIGPATLRGSVGATVAPQRVKEILADLRTLTQPARQTAAVLPRPEAGERHQGAPARTPTGP